MTLDYYELVSSLCMMINPKMRCRMLRTGYHIWLTHNAKISQLHYYEIDTIPLHDDRAPQILSSIVKNCQIVRSS
jgi:hypothetical protein